MNFDIEIRFPHNKTILPKSKYCEESILICYVSITIQGIVMHGITVSSALIGCIIGGSISGFDDPNWDASIESFELPSDGTYRIEISGVIHYSGGDYTLIVESDKATAD